MSSHVLMFTTEVCPYCLRAEQLLRARGVSEIEKIRVDLEPEKWDELVKQTACRTVPQIFIADRHIGGCDDLVALDQRGELDPLLKTP